MRSEMGDGAPSPLIPLITPHTHLGQVGPDGLDLVVEDIVLLHLMLHQWKVRPKSLGAQLVLGASAGSSALPVSRGPGEPPPA